MYRDVTGVAVRDLIEQAGREGSVQIIREGLKEGKVKPENFSLRELWEGIRYARPSGGRYFYKDVQEAVTSDLFPVITSELINAKTIQAYEAVPKVGENMVEVVPSKLKEDTIAGYSSGDEPNVVLEGQSYNESEITEKYYKGRPAEKIGRIISISEEMIFFDQTRTVLNAAQDIGRQIGNTREQRIIESLQDAGQWAGQIYLFWIRRSDLDKWLCTVKKHIKRTGSKALECRFGAPKHQSKKKDSTRRVLQSPAAGGKEVHWFIG